MRKAHLFKVDANACERLALRFVDSVNSAQKAKCISGMISNMAGKAGQEQTYVIANAIRTGNCSLDHANGNMPSSGDSLMRGMKTILPACVPVAITACSRRPLITFCTKSLVPLQSPSMGERLRKSMTTMLGLSRKSCRGSPDRDSVLSHSSHSASKRLTLEGQ